MDQKKARMIKDSRLGKFVRKIEPEELKAVAGGFIGDDEEREPCGVVKPKVGAPVVIKP